MFLLNDFSLRVFPQTVCPHYETKFRSGLGFFFIWGSYGKFRSGVLRGVLLRPRLSILVGIHSHTLFGVSCRDKFVFWGGIQKALLRNLLVLFSPPVFGNDTASQLTNRICLDRL